MKTSQPTNQPDLVPACPCGIPLPPFLIPLPMGRPLLSRSGIKRIHLKQDEEGDKGVDSACDLESELEKTVGSGKREIWRTRPFRSLG